MSKLILILLLFSNICFAQQSLKIRVVTEHFPPFQIVKDGDNVDGIVVKIVEKLLQETNTEANIEPLPWARAYNLALNRPNTLIFSIARNKQRESLFHWVASFKPMNSYLWTLKNNNSITDTSIENLKKFLVVVPREGNTLHTLEKNGFQIGKNLYVVNTREQAVLMLFNGRSDLLMSSQELLQERVSSLGLNFNKLKKVRIVEERQFGLSIAFSKSTSEEVVEKFKKAFVEATTRSYVWQLHRPSKLNGVNLNGVRYTLFMANYQLSIQPYLMCI